MPSALARKLRACGSDERGSIAVEAAVATPFLMLLAAGIVEFGSVFYNYNLIQTGVRDAARYLSRVADPASAEAAARKLAVSGSLVDGAPRRISWWQAGHIQITYRQMPNPVDAATGLRMYRGNDPLTTVSVSTAVDYAGLALLPLLGVNQLRITAAHEERHVGR